MNLPELPKSELGSEESRKKTEERRRNDFREYCNRAAVEYAFTDEKSENYLEMLNSAFADQLASIIRNCLADIVDDSVFMAGEDGELVLFCTLSNFGVGDVEFHVNAKPKYFQSGIGSGFSESAKNIYDFKAMVEAKEAEKYRHPEDLLDEIKDAELFLDALVRRSELVRQEIECMKKIQQLKDG